VAADGLAVDADDDVLQTVTVLHGARAPRATSRVTQPAAEQASQPHVLLALTSQINCRDAAAGAELGNQRAQLLWRQHHAPRPTKLIAAAASAAAAAAALELPKVDVVRASVAEQDVRDVVLVLQVACFMETHLLGVWVGYVVFQNKSMMCTKMQTPPAAATAGSRQQTQTKSAHQRQQKTQATKSAAAAANKTSNQISSSRKQQPAAASSSKGGEEGEEGRRERVRGTYDNPF